MSHRLLMIVDDDPRMRAFIEEVFAGEALQVAAANGGVEALALAADVVPDLVLLDLQMPGMDGIQVCRKLRALSEMARVPIVIFSVRPDASTVTQAFLAGADDFVAKPFSLATLEGKVEHWLQARHHLPQDTLQAGSV